MDAALARLRVSWAVYWPDSDLDAITGDVRTRLAEALSEWPIEKARPLPGGYVALVCEGRLEGRPVILKVSPAGHPDSSQLAAEGAALAWWQPTGVVPELIHQRDEGLTLLMERVQPGRPLAESGLAWHDLLPILGGLAARLHAAGRPPGRWTTTGAYTDYWRGVLEEEPGALEELDDLTRPDNRDVLIHADLHPGNALSAGDTWKVIDPHAVVGDRHADIWALLDPLVLDLPADPLEAKREARRRVASYVESAGLDSARTAAWARLRGRAEALAIDRRNAAPADERAWAVRLHRMADALSA